MHMFIYFHGEVSLYTFSSVVVIKLLYAYSVQSHFFLFITLQSQFGAASICSCLHGSMDDIAVVVHAFNVY